MKTLIVAVTIAMAGCSQLPARMVQNLDCAKVTTAQAFRGDFHDIALPAFVPGAHLAAGQVSSCMAR